MCFIVYFTAGEAWPTWAKYLKRVLVEESHSLAHLIHILQLIVRQGDLFYSSRSQVWALSSYDMSCSGPQSNTQA